MKPVAKPARFPIAVSVIVGPRKSGPAVMTFALAAVWPANALWVTPTVAAATAIAVTAARAADLALSGRLTVAPVRAPDGRELEHEQQGQGGAEEDDEQALGAGVHENPAELGDPVHDPADLTARRHAPA